MQQQQTSSAPFAELFNSFKRAGEKIKQAMEEDELNFYTFDSIQKDTLDFELLEQDIQNIHKQLERGGSIVLGSHLIIDDRQELLTIKTYSRQGEKSFVSPFEVKVKSIINIPTDLGEAIQREGRVEFSFKFDD